MCTEILCLDHVAEVLQLSLVDSGYKFAVCADLVQHRFIRSVFLPADSRHTFVERHLEGFQLVDGGESWTLKAATCPATHM